MIGVNSSIYSPSGGSVGLGFAIPINRAARVVDDLLAHGAVRSPWIGVRLAAAAVEQSARRHRAGRRHRARHAGLAGRQRRASSRAT